MKFEKCRSFAVWISATIAISLPWLVAFDNGGVFPWTRWFTGVVMLFPIAISLWELRFTELPSAFRQFGLIVAALALAGIALLQLIPLPLPLTQVLSRGVSDAQGSWLNPVVEAGLIEPIWWNSTNIAPDAGWGYVSYFCLLGGFLWCGHTLFLSRSRALLLLSLFSILGGCHALVGILQVLSTPHETIWGVVGANPFGAFINSNNAAGLLLVGLAGCIGIFAWRLSILTGYSIGEEGFQFSSLLDMANDRLAVLTAGGGFVSFMGIVTTGSRGGLVAAMCGGAIAFGLLKVERIAVRVAFVAGLVAICCTILFVRFEVNPENIDRFGATANGLAESILSDGRWAHWSDAKNAIARYLPMGAGFGAYKYAYLPYQSHGNAKWFHHADNLWLEWLLEGGVLVALIISAVAFVIGRAIMTLQRSHDPMDQGLAAGGAFAVVAMSVSQLFDFGFLFVGTSGAFCLLIGLVMARSTMVVSESGNASRSKQQIRFVDSASSKTNYAVGGVVSVVLASSLVLMHTDAFADATNRYAMQVDLRDQQRLSEVLEALAGDELAEHSANLLYQHSRLMLAQAENEIVSSLSAFDWYVEFSGSLRGNVLARHAILLRLFQDNAIRNPEFYGDASQAIVNAFKGASPSLRQAIHLAAQSLMKQPLSPESRFIIIWANLGLQIAGEGNSILGRQLSEQLAVLRVGAVDAMDDLAEIAVLNGEWESAFKCWQQFLVAKPEQSYRIMVFAESLGAEDPIAAIPRSYVAYEFIAEKMVLDGRAKPEHLETVFNFLVEEIPRERKRRIRRYLLLGQLAEKLNDEEKALEYYEKLTLADPTQFSQRVRLINYLRKIGRLRQAKEYTVKLSEERPELADDLEPYTERIQAEIDRMNRELTTPLPSLID